MVDMADGADVDVGLFAFEFATGSFDGERTATAREDGSGGDGSEERREEGRGEVGRG